MTESSPVCDSVNNSSNNLNNPDIETLSALRTHKHNLHVWISWGFSMI